jgi:hypothetical protein
MVKNEDVYIEQAIRNVVEFCDIIYVDDNESTDQTSLILERLEREITHLHVRTISDTIESNEKLVPYFGTDTWVFAVDGDEIYDRNRLPEMRRRLESGEFDNWWLVLGNCLHVTRIDEARSQAEGYLAPPSSSMTKLYNFSLIKDFPIKDERLHGTPVFKDGGDAPSKWYYFCRNQSWDDSCFRCVHTAFVKRTSKPHDQKRVFGVRLNPPQIYTLKKIWKDNSFFYAFPRAVKLVVEIILGIDSRQKRYKSGPRVTKSVSEFFVNKATEPNQQKDVTIR